MLSAIKILAIDNHPLFAEGIAVCLKSFPLVTYVDTCSTYDDMLHKLKSDTPHLVFLELNLERKGYDGFVLCHEIRNRYKNVFVAILSRYNDERFIRQARECGAGAYFDKNTGIETLYEFLHEFSQGKIEQYYIHVLPRKEGDKTFERDDFELKCLLTKRELELMRLIVAGKELKEIEQEMSISYETFRTHHNNLLGKLNLKNDVQLTHFAIQHKLTDEDFRVSYTPVPNSIKLRN